MIRAALVRLGLMREAAPASAAGRTIEARDDDEGWRPISRDRQRDLSPVDQRRMQELAYHGWEQHRAANRLVELPIAFMLGDGARVEVDDEQAQAWLDAWWSDPINRFDLRLEKRMRDLSIFGEQVITTYTNPISGHVRHGAIDAHNITDVITDPDNAGLVIGVEIADRAGQKRTYKVNLDGDDAELLRVPALVLRENMTAGECHFWQINDLLSGSRGRSDLLSAIDLADAYTQLIFGEVERAVALRSVMWDVKMTGATAEQVEARARKIGPPTPMSTRVHNEMEEWAVLSPALGSADANGTLRTVRNEILGGGTIPEHWYGGGGDVNRATAAEMDEPTYVVFRRRQLFWVAILEAEARHVIRCRLRAMGRDPAKEMQDPAMRPRALLPAMKSEDISRYAAALAQVVSAVLAAINDGLMTEETGLSIIAAVAAKMGVEVDPADELEKARAQATKKREADAFAPPPPDPDAQGQP
ncbi:MAG: hypothetical protein PHS60_10910 [Zavarzinia sp.]|nr:hypothetical protein [Zavarzinia sp.]